MTSLFSCDPPLTGEKERDRERSVSVSQHILTLIPVLLLRNLNSSRPKAAFTGEIKIVFAKLGL